MILQGFECKILTPYLEKAVPNVFIPLIFMEFIHIQNNLDNNCPGKETQILSQQDHIKLEEDS